MRAASLHMAQCRPSGLVMSWWAALISGVLLSEVAAVRLSSTSLSKSLTTGRLNKQLSDASWDKDCSAARQCDHSCFTEINESGRWLLPDESLLPKFTLQMKVLQSDMYVSRIALCLGQTWEWGDVRYLLSLLQNASHGTFLDIGANLGSWTLPMLAAKRNLKAVSVDVSSTMTGMLRESLQKNDFQSRASVNTFAVVQKVVPGRKVCMGQLESKMSTSDNAGGNQVNLGSRTVCKEEVVARTLDDLYAENPDMQHVVAAKFDCEGCEGQALLGATRFLSERPPCIIGMEITPRYLCEAESPLEHVIAALDSAGYDTFQIRQLPNSTLACADITAIRQDFVILQHKNVMKCLESYARNAKSSSAGSAQTQLDAKPVSRRTFIRSDVGLEQACPAAQECNSSCWADIDQGGRWSFNVGGFNLLPFTLHMKVLQTDMYISRTALCERQTWEWSTVKELLLKLMGTYYGTFLDIGANLGSWTLPMLAAKRSFNAVSVDVSSTMTSMLQESINRNNFQNRSLVNNFAVVQDMIPGKKICMNTAEKDMLTSSNTGGNQVNLGSRTECKQEVVARTLDDVYEKNPWMQHVVAAKFDCEGCEGQALMGARRLLAERPPCMLAIEITPKYLCESGSPLQALTTTLEEAGYETSALKSLPMSQLSCSNIKDVRQDFVVLEHRHMASCLANYSRSARLLFTESSATLNSRAVSERLMSTRRGQQQAAGLDDECGTVQQCKQVCFVAINEGNSWRQGDFSVPKFQLLMKVHQADAYSSRTALCTGKTWDWQGLKDLLRTLRSTSSGTFLDVGAHAGGWTLPLLAAKTDFEAVSIDASSTMTTMLQESLRQNGFQNRSTVHNIAVVKEVLPGHKTCVSHAEKDIFRSNNSGANQVNHGIREFCAEEVKPRTLDDLYTADPIMQTVVAARLDCEGCEGQAILGAKQFLNERPPCVLAMQITPRYLCEAGSEPQVLSSTLFKAGYNTSEFNALPDIEIGCDAILRSDDVRQHFLLITQRHLEACLERYSRNDAGDIDKSDKSEIMFAATPHSIIESL
eukprot:gnl/TRDRNA2_/TRDRNA2_35865_c0_seq1.p1 gnl/TRDRNA2_/TRDRNA2_35865_c0~~gnl/TRDRNA2_/TRDRNA2_35865_c0_seq1.p1  ORF type:complete len:1043 (+),score=154.42 gnl/TRDRNA2_/TRDRNA2_35865_c0_seq1:3-3131(+)